MSTTAIRWVSDAKRYDITTTAFATVGFIGCFDPDNKHTQAHIKNVFGSGDGQPDLVLMLGDLVYHTWSDDGVKSAEDCRKLATLMQNTPNTLFFATHGNHEGRVHGGRRKHLGRAERMLAGTSVITESVVRKSFRMGYYDRQALEGWGTQPQLSSIERRTIRGAYGRRTGDQHWVFHDEPANPRISVGDQQLPQFNMGPDGYYVLSLKLDQGAAPYVDIIVLDTTTLPYDEAQCQWLIDTINASTADQIIIAGHHGIMTPVFDKRLTSVTDAKLYADACAEFMAEREANEPNPTPEQRQSLLRRQQDAKDKVQARYQQLLAVSGSEQVGILNHIYHREIFLKLDQSKAAKIQVNICAHAHNLQATATPKGNTLVVGGGMGGKLNRVLIDYGKETGHLLYGEKTTGVVVMEIGSTIKGKFIAGIPHQHIGDSLSIEHAKFEIDPYHNMTVRRMKDNVEHRVWITRIAGQGWTVQQTEQPVGGQVKLLVTRGCLSEARVVVTPSSQGQQVASALPGPLQTISEFLQAMSAFDSSVSSLARAAGIPELQGDGLTAALRLKPQSLLSGLFHSPQHVNQRLHQLMALLAQARRMRQFVLATHLKKGPWQDGPLIALLEGLTDCHSKIKNKIQAGGSLAQLALPEVDANQLLQQLTKLQHSHGQSHHIWKVTVEPALLFIGITALAALLIVAGDVIFDGGLGLRTDLGMGGALLFAVLIAQMVARAQSRRADTGLEAEVTKHISSLRSFIKEIQASAEESTYESLDDLERHVGCCGFGGSR